MEPPFALTYLPPSLNLPSWLSETSFPTQTTIIQFPQTDEVGRSIGIESATITQFSTQIIQLPITVEVNSGVQLSFPFVSEGNTNPTFVSELGASTFILLSSASDYDSTSTSFQNSFESTSYVMAPTSSTSTTAFVSKTTMLSITAVVDSFSSSGILTASVAINISPPSKTQLQLPTETPTSSFLNFSDSIPTIITTQTIVYPLLNLTTAFPTPTTPTQLLHSSRLSGSEIAGIALGAIAFGLLLLGLLYYLCFRNGRMSSTNSNAADYGSLFDDTESREILDGSHSRYGSTGAVRGSIWGLGGLVSFKSSPRASLTTTEARTRQIEENEVLFDSGNIDEFGREGDGRHDRSKPGLINTLDPKRLFPQTSTARSRRFVNPVVVEEISESSAGDFGGSDLGLGSRNSDVASSSNLKFDDIPNPSLLFLSSPNRWTPQAVSSSEQLASSEFKPLSRRYLLPPINTLPGHFLETPLSSTLDTTISKNIPGFNIVRDQSIKHEHNSSSSQSLDRRSVGTFGAYKSITREESVSETNHSRSSSSGAHSNVSSGKASSTSSSPVSSNSLRKYESFLEAHSQIVKGGGKRNTLGASKD